MNETAIRPWNKGRAVGPRDALTHEQVSRIFLELEGLPSSHDLCLFAVAIDTMLRASDLLRLRVGDLRLSSGEIAECFYIRQKKTSGNVAPTLTAKTQSAAERWVAESNKQAPDFLFTRQKSPHGSPISIGYYRALVKSWAKAIDLPPERYSSHTLRRTKPRYLYKNGVSVETISILLGHRSSVTTIRYLGLDQASAHEAALEFDILS